jgi:hypothetical protein
MNSAETSRSASLLGRRVLRLYSVMISVSLNLVSSRLRKTGRTQLVIFCISSFGIIHAIFHQVYSPYQKNWIATLNTSINEYLGSAPLPQPNSEAIHESVIYGPLFDTPIPDEVEGFALEDTDKRQMEEIWPAGTQAAKDVGILIFCSVPSYLSL